MHITVFFAHKFGLKGVVSPQRECLCGVGENIYVNAESFINQ